MTTLHQSAQAQLRQIIEQIERLEEEKANVAELIKDQLASAKGFGFDVKAIKALIKLRRKSDDERQQEQAILDTYMHALGMTPMEQLWREAAE